MQLLPPPSSRTHQKRWNSREENVIPLQSDNGHMVSLFFVSFFCHKKRGKEAMYARLVIPPENVIGHLSQHGTQPDPYTLQSVPSIPHTECAFASAGSAPHRFKAKVFPLPLSQLQGGRRRKPPFSLPILNTPVPSSSSIPSAILSPMAHYSYSDERRKRRPYSVPFLFPLLLSFPPYSSNVQRAFYSAPTFFLFFLENREILHPPYFRSKKAAISFKIARYKKVSLFHNPLDVGIITLFPPGYTVHNSVSHIFF